jgi:hypothetical protein
MEALKLLFLASSVASLFARPAKMRLDFLTKGACFRPFLGVSSSC